MKSRQKYLSLIRLKKILYPYHYLFLLGIFLSIFGALSSLGLPLIMGSLADLDRMNFILSHKNMIIFGVFGIILIYGIQGLATYILGRVGANVVKNLENNFIKHTLSLPIYQIDSLSSGDLSSRLTNDITGVAKVITTTIPQIIINTIIIMGTSLILLSINSHLTLLALMVIALTGIILIPFNKKIEKLYNIHQTFLGEVSGAYIQRILNNRLVKGYLGEKQEVSFFNRKFDKIYFNFTDMVATIAFLNTLTSVFLILIVLTFLLYTSWQVNNNVLTLSEMVTFILYIIQVVSPVSDILSNISEIFEAKGTLKRITDILKIRREDDEENFLDFEFLNGDISFKNVSFGYEKTENVLNNVNFDIPSKRLIAIVGPSGSGKTTIFSLLLKFFKDYRGSILIDGRPIKVISKHDIRRQISCVFQDSTFFTASIKENLLYGKNKCVSDIEIRDVLKKSGALHFTNELPQKIDTIIGEGGVELSEGQKQRINIARALISKPKILLMDEATASLDTVTESLIIRTLLEVKKSVTTVIIAHRLSTVTAADLIIVLEKNGTVKHVGTHDQLLSRSGTYKKMYNELIH